MVGVIMSSVILPSAVAANSMTPFVRNLAVLQKYVFITSFCVFAF
jgi:hypothetical protein